MPKPTGKRKPTPVRPSGMVSTFPDFYATKVIDKTFDVPGHGKIKVNLKPGDRMPGEIQSYPVINHLKLGGSVEDANARIGERRMKWKPRARPQAGQGPSPAADIPDGIIVTEAVGKALDAAGFDTAEKIRAATDKELLAIKGVGAKTLKDLRTLAGMVPEPEPEPDETSGPDTGTEPAPDETVPTTDDETEPADETTPDPDAEIPGGF